MQLHSFDNGSKLATKNDNWDQLYLFFRKKGIPLGKLDFDPVIHCVTRASHGMTFLPSATKIPATKRVDEVTEHFFPCNEKRSVQVSFLFQPLSAIFEKREND